MTPARVVESDKIMKAVTVFVTQITFTSNFLLETCHIIGNQFVISEMVPLRGVNTFEIMPTK